MGVRSDRVRWLYGALAVVAGLCFYVSMAVTATAATEASEGEFHVRINELHDNGFNVTWRCGESGEWAYFPDGFGDGTWTPGYDTASVDFYYGWVRVFAGGSNLIAQIADYPCTVEEPGPTGSTGGTGDTGEAGATGPTGPPGDSSGLASVEQSSDSVAQTVAFAAGLLAAMLAMAVFLRGVTA